MPVPGSPRLCTVPHGPEALEALARAIDDAKGGDPLAPVTVVPPNVYAGLGLRRALARRGGVANTRFMPLGRVAELLGAASLAAAGRRPLIPAVRAAAVRVALARDPGALADVAGHPATARALERTFADLRGLGDGDLARLAATGGRAATVVALFHAFRAVVAPRYYDEHDLAAAAARAVEAGAPGLADVGAVVLHLPPPGADEEPLPAALARAGRLWVLAGLTDEEGASPPVPHRAVVAPDAGEEVRFVLRDVARRLEDGTPLHRMAVLHATSQPYARLVHDVFTDAGMPHHSPPVRTLGETVAGRTLLGLLHLADDEFARRDVLAWLHAAPVLEAPGGGEVPAPAWDRLTREAGVVRGPEQWQRRLAGLQRRLEAEGAARGADSDAADPEGESDRLAADHDLATRLRHFVQELTGHVRAAPEGSWRDLTSWATRLLVRYLGTETERAPWPDAEHEAFAAVEEAVGSLAGLDGVEPEPDLATFRRAVSELLHEPAGRVGRFGDGVFVGGLGQAAGGDFDVVYVVGMSEGALPSRPADDPLLPEHEAARGGRAEERRRYLAALAAGAERVLVAPRADVRGQQERAPSRWFSDAVAALTGQRHATPDLDALRGDHFRAPAARVQSIEEGLMAAGAHPASARDRDLVALMAASPAGEPPAHLARGWEAVRARQEGVAGPWTGFVGVTGPLITGAPRPLSPTALEDWARCPFRHFLARVLRVAERDDPQDIERLGVVDRGSLVHEVLERFVGEHLDAVAPGEPWSDEARARARAIGEEVLDEYEERGRTGRALLWAHDRRHILAELERALTADDEMRAQLGSQPVAVEMRFGVEGEQPVEVDVGGGRRVHLRGQVDRVDRAGDGLVVLDYKTGRPDDYRELDDDLVAGGRRLQLPVYALAARRRFGDDLPVAAQYWFVSDRGRYRRLPEEPEMTAERMARFVEALDVIVEGAEGGVFPARPGEDSWDYVRRRDHWAHCRWCAYDRLCRTDRGDVWEQVRGDARLARFRVLAGEEAPG